MKKGRRRSLNEHNYRRGLEFIVVAVYGVCKENISWQIVADVLKWKLPRMYIITSEPHTMMIRCDSSRLLGVIPQEAPVSNLGQASFLNRILEETNSIQPI